MFARVSARSSRAVARSLMTTNKFAPSVFSNKLQNKEFIREFNSSNKLNQATAAAAPASVEKNDPKTILDRYGASSFWATLAAILVTKEVFIIDAEFLLAVETICFVTAAYVVTGDTWSKMCEAEEKARVDKFNDANNFVLDMLNQYKMGLTVNQQKPAVLEQYLKEYKASLIQEAAHKTVVPKHEARAKVIAALEAIKTKEELAAAAEWQETVDAVVSNVKAAFAKGDAKLSNDMLALAMKNLGQNNVPTTTVEEDPVKRTFVAEFEKFGK